MQRDIEVNHLALVDAARGGSAMKLRLDEREFELRTFHFDGFSTSTLVLDEELDADARNKLRDSQFAFPEEGKLPINDESHVRAAMGGHGFSATDFSKHPAARATAFHKIVAAAKAHGIDSTNFEKEYGGRNDSQPEERIIMADPVIPTVRSDEAFRSLEAQLINKTAEAKEATEKLAAATSRADAAEGKVQELSKQIPILPECEADRARCQRDGRDQEASDSRRRRRDAARRAEAVVGYRDSRACRSRAPLRAAHPALSA